MRLLSKLRRRKCHEDLQALSASLPEVPFTDQASESTEVGAPASEDSGYGSTENTSPFATTLTELSTSEEEDTPEKKFAQLADFDRDVLHRRRRATIRFELFGNDDAEDEDAEGGVQNIARPVQRPQLGISTSEIVPRPPAATTPLSADPPQPLPYRLPPARTPRLATHPSFERRYHTAASQRLLDVTHGRIAASRRRAESFPGFVSGGDNPAGSLLAPSSTHPPATIRESRYSVKDPLRVRLARSTLLVKLRNGVTPAEAGELCFAPTGRSSAPAQRPPSYSFATSAIPPQSGPCPSANPPHPLALVLPRLPVWAHRPSYVQRCVVTSAYADGSKDDEIHTKPDAPRPGRAAISSRVATIVGELAEHERLRISLVHPTPAPAPAPDDTSSSNSLLAQGPPRGPTCGIAARSGLPALAKHRSTLSAREAAQAASSPSTATPEPGRSFTPATVATTAERPHRVRLLDGGRQQAEDDDERPLATLRRSASVLSVIPRQQLDCELLSAQISMPFWLPPLASATHPHAIAWRPLSGAGMPAAPRSPRGAIVGLSRHEFTSTENSHKETAEPIPRVAPTCLVCSPVSARRVTDKPFPGSLHWPTPSLSAGAAPKSVSFPIPARSRQMPIAARKPDLRSRRSSVELHGSFKVIEHDFRLASMSKRWTAGGVSLRKARSFWHATPDTPSTCCA